MRRFPGTKTTSAEVWSNEVKPEGENAEEMDVMSGRNKHLLLLRITLRAYQIYQRLRFQLENKPG